MPDSCPYPSTTVHDSLCAECERTENTMLQPPIPVQTGGMFMIGLRAAQAKTAYERGRYSEAAAHGQKVWNAITFGTIVTVLLLAALVGGINTIVTVLLLAAQVGGIVTVLLLAALVGGIDTIVTVLLLAALVGAIGTIVTVLFLAALVGAIVFYLTLIVS